MSRSTELLDFLETIPTLASKFLLNDLFPTNNSKGFGKLPEYLNSLAPLELNEGSAFLTSGAYEAIKNDTGLEELFRMMSYCGVVIDTELLNSNQLFHYNPAVETNQEFPFLHIKKNDQSSIVRIIPNSYQDTENTKTPFCLKNELNW